MDPTAPDRSLNMLLVVAGVALLAAAVVLFLIDSDPTWLFGDPVLSAVLALAGAAAVFMGWKKTRPQVSDE